MSDENRSLEEVIAEAKHVDDWDELEAELERQMQKSLGNTDFDEGHE